MSVIVKNMEMPESCRKCKCYKIETEMWHDEYDMCCLKNKDIRDLDVRPKWCPLKEIPTPHGRLIDADKIEYHFEVNENTAMEGCEFVTKDEIGRVPTVLKRSN